MEKEDFIRLIKMSVRDSAMKSSFEVIVKPPGRDPGKDLVELSRWFNLLSDKDQELVQRIAQTTLDQGIHNFLCILDGVKVLGGKYKDGDFLLLFKSGDGETVINSKRNDLTELHDIYNWELNQLKEEQ